MAKLCLLLDALQLNEKPDTIKVLAEWGFVTIRYADDAGNEQWFTGIHLAVEGDVSEIRSYLNKLGPVWVGKGIPQLQEFERLTISEELCTTG